MFADINGWEFVIIVVVSLVLIGPDRLPEYAAKLGRAVRQLRQLAEGAKVQLREQMGPEFDDVDWSAYDPRQYDPRRIVRDALNGDPADDAGGVARSAANDASAFTPPGTRYDPEVPTPYDPDAT